MIKLYDNLYLSADPKNLILIKDDGETDKKGRPVRKTLGYYRSIGALVQAALRRSRNIAVSEANSFEELKQLIEELEAKADGLQERIDRQYHGS